MSALLSLDQPGDPEPAAALTPIAGDLAPSGMMILPAMSPSVTAARFSAPRPPHSLNHKGGFSIYGKATIRRTSLP